MSTPENISLQQMRADKDEQRKRVKALINVYGNETKTLTLDMQSPTAQNPFGITVLEVDQPFVQALKKIELSLDRDVIVLAAMLAHFRAA